MNEVSVALAATNGAALVGRSLPDLEAAIERGFTEAAMAYREIRDKRRYEPDYTDFDTYCRDRWNLSRRRVDQLIDGYEVVEVLRNIVSQSELPTNDRQARALLPLLDRPEEMAAALEEARSEAEEKKSKLTTKRIEAAVSRRLASASRPPETPHEEGTPTGEEPPMPLATADPGQEVEDEQAPLSPEDRDFWQMREDLTQAAIAHGALMRVLSGQIYPEDFTINELRALRKHVDALSRATAAAGTLTEAVAQRRTQRGGESMPRAPRRERALSGVSEAVIHHLRENGGQTCRDLEQALGVAHEQISARLVNLEQRGLVVKTGEKQPTASGKLANVYAAVVQNDA